MLRVIVKKAAHVERNMPILEMRTSVGTIPSLHVKWYNGWKGIFSTLDFPCTNQVKFYLVWTRQENLIWQDCYVEKIVSSTVHMHNHYVNADCTDITYNWLTSVIPNPKPQNYDTVHFHCMRSYTFFSKCLLGGKKKLIKISTDF